MIAELKKKMPEGLVANKVEPDVSTNTNQAAEVEGGMEVVRELVSRGTDGSVYHGMAKVRVDGLRVVKEGGGLKATKEDLGRPGEFGWQREVVRHPQGGHVTGVHYVTPPHPATGVRRRLKRMKEIAAYLATADTPQLSLANFVLNSRAVGLAFEVERRPITPGTARSQYAQFMRALGGGRMEDGPGESKS